MLLSPSQHCSNPLSAWQHPRLDPGGSRGPWGPGCWQRCCGCRCMRGSSAQEGLAVVRCRRRCPTCVACLPQHASTQLSPQPCSQPRHRLCRSGGTQREQSCTADRVLPRPVIVQSLFQEFHFGKAALSLLAREERPGLRSLSTACRTAGAQGARLKGRHALCLPDKRHQLLWQVKPL